MSCKSIVTFPSCDSVYIILVVVIVLFQLSMWGSLISRETLNYSFYFRGTVIYP